MGTTAERLRKALDMRQMKQSELAAITGIGKSSISTYLSGDYLPKQRNVYKMALALDVSEAWLMGADVPMERSAMAHTETSVPVGFEPMPSMKRVPLIGRIACGNPITAEENIEGYISVPDEWNATFTLMCEGDSMAPRIQNGDVVAVRKQDTVENGQIAAVRIDNEATLKHVYVYPDYIELRPENPSFESIIKIGPAMNEVYIEGLAVGICRGIS